MNFVKNYRCTNCQRTYALDESLYTCLICEEEGILDIEYDYELMRKVVTKAYFAQCKEFSIWRYAPLMSVHQGYIQNTLKVGWTPLYQAKTLQKMLNIDSLYLKDETVNPTASLKDRASVVAVVKALEYKKDTIACSSTGNAASSLAGQAAKVGLKTVIFVPKRVPIGKLTQLSLFGAHVYKVDGNYKATYNLSKEAINQYKWYNRNAAINPHLVEGKKTVAYEIAEQLQFNPTEWVVVSVGDGCTIAGVYKGFYDLFKLNLIEKIPKLLGVQSEGCAPIYHAFKKNSKVVETDEDTIADSIAVGKPRNPIKALEAVKKSGGSYITVSDEAIIKAMQELAKKEGIFAEPAAAASYAGLRKAMNEKIIKEYESVTIIITGNGLKDPQNAQKAMHEIPEVSSDLEAFMNRFEKEA